MANADIRQLEMDGKVFYPQTDIHGLVNNGAFAIDDEPTQGSSNLVTSDSVYRIKSETLQENREMVDSVMQDYAPVEIHGDVTNAADEEDLTSTNVDGTDVLKFKDKVYNQLVYSGMGKKILRKNMVNGVNTLTQSMINDENTIYIIQYDFVLGDDITVPANCVLEFDGGSISGNYIITGQHTGIVSAFTKIFNCTASVSGTTVTLTGTRLAGTWRIKELYTEWFGAIGDGITDDTNAVQVTTTLSYTLKLPVQFLGKRYFIGSITLPTFVDYRGVSANDTSLYNMSGRTESMFVQDSSVSCPHKFRDIKFHGNFRLTLFSNPFNAGEVSNCEIYSFNVVFAGKVGNTTKIHHNSINTVGKTVFEGEVVDANIDNNYISGYRFSEDDTKVFAGSVDTTTINNNYIDFFKYVVSCTGCTTNIFAENHIEYCYRVFDGLNKTLVRNIITNNRISNITNQESRFSTQNEEMQNYPSAIFVVGKKYNASWEISEPIATFLNNSIEGNYLDGKIDIWSFVTNTPINTTFRDNKYLNPSLVQINLLGENETVRNTYIDFYDGVEMDETLFNSVGSSSVRASQGVYIGRKAIYNGVEISYYPEDGYVKWKNPNGDYAIKGLANSLRDSLDIGCAYIRYLPAKAYNSSTGTYNNSGYSVSTEPILVEGKETANFIVTQGVTLSDPIPIYWLDSSKTFISNESVSRNGGSKTVPSNAKWVILNLDRRMEPKDVRLYLE